MVGHGVTLPIANTTIPLQLKLGRSDRQHKKDGRFAVADLTITGDLTELLKLSLQTREGAGMTSPSRRFPPPWSVDEQSACFVVRDHNGQQLAHVYFEDEPGRRSAAKLLTKDEARTLFCI
jgi:hypothetical protein